MLVASMYVDALRLRSTCLSSCADVSQYYFAGTESVYFDARDTMSENGLDGAFRS